MDLEKSKHQQQKIITQATIGYTFNFIRNQYDDKSIVRAYNQMVLWGADQNEYCLTFMNEVKINLSTEEFPELWI